MKELICIHNENNKTLTLGKRYVNSGSISTGVNTYYRILCDDNKYKICNSNLFIKIEIYRDLLIRNILE